MHVTYRSAVRTNDTYQAKMQRTQITAQPLRDARRIINEREKEYIHVPAFSGHIQVTQEKYESAWTVLG